MPKHLDIWLVTLLPSIEVSTELAVKTKLEDLNEEEESVELEELTKPDSINRVDRVNWVVEVIEKNVWDSTKWVASID